ncbi:coiled-coil domain-containing protein [Maribacter dokdonensis]|uniref:AAA family ATPase n=1 Tax=Maribacter dokdonensis TaxID=320912 RepID=UPI000B1E97FA|nr:AAA family ATPase [Maribacter dokdonensis]
MALKIKTPKLVVNCLYLVGRRKNYRVNFRNGLNIIYGDSDTGKSSILNLVNYCLGASSIDLYDEIEIAGDYCLLEVLLLGTKYTIKRDIFNPKSEIEVYESSYDEIENYFPKYYSPNYSQVSEDGIFSEFLLNSMNIPVVKLKESPSKVDSKMKSLSFRDIFKYNYLTQDKVGSKFLFGENYVLIAKLKETFKLMYNVLDTQITQLEGIIGEKVKERNDLNKKNTAISSFLKETEIDSIKRIMEKKEEKELELEKLREDIARIDSEIMSDNSDLDSIRNEIKYIEKEIYEMSSNREVREQELKQNIALRNEYSNDIKKIKGTIEVLEKFPNIEDRDTSCPVCEQTMKISTLKNQFINSNTQSIKAELNGLRRRQKDLRAIYENLKDFISKADGEVKEKTERLNGLREQFDKQTKELVTPFISLRDSLTSKIGGIKVI